MALMAAYQEPALSASEMSRRAAVLAIITADPEPSLIYTLRAKHLNHHAGEVCFPGGKYEPADTNLCETALRETHEEIGLAPNRVQVLGALKPRQTRSGMLVHPYLGVAPKGFIPRLNLHELDLLFQVPLVAFDRGIQVRTDVFERQGQQFRFPAYVYQGHTIWGFTAGVTEDLLTIFAKNSQKSSI